MEKYLIAVGGSLTSLEEEVNKKIDEGYTPIGIIGLARYGTAQIDKMYYQPMILTTPKVKTQPSAEDEPTIIKPGE